MGLTASTSSYTQDIEISNIKVETVIPSSSTSFAIFSPSNIANIRTNENFVIDLYIRDSCKNRYVPIDSDSINDISWREDPSSNCNLRTVSIGTNNGFQEKGPSYLVYFSCSQVGEKTIQLLYKGKLISNEITVKIDANVLSRAKTDIMDQILSNKIPNIDKGFDFKLIPLDNGNNLAITTSEDILNKVAVVWENPADTRKDHIVTLNPDGSYNFHINTDKASEYRISSSLFLNEIEGGSYIIVAKHGAPNPNNSFAMIYDDSDPNNPLFFETTKIKAGQNAKAIIHLKDRLNNTILITKELRASSSFSLYENGVEKQLDTTFLGQDNLQMTLAFKMTIKGPNMFVAYYGSEAITCLNCIYTVNALESLFTNSDLFIYNTSAKAYIPNEGSVYHLEKTDKFEFLMVLKDKFGNIIDNIDVFNYKAELSGNLMKPLQLVLNPYTSNGLQVLINDTDYQYYQNLVGKDNYLIKITQTSDSKFSIRNFPLTIISDGSDSDSSNGDILPIRTMISWAIAPLNNKCLVGKVYRVAIKLVTQTGARYNAWLDNSKIAAQLDVFFANNGEIIYEIRKDLKPGMYLMDFMLTKASGKLRTLSYKVNNISILLKSRFYDLAGDANQAYVDNVISELQMKSGVILNKYPFTFSLFDKYMNPVDSSALDLVLKLNSNDLVNLKPECVKNDLGVYFCSFLPNIAGNYTLNSGFFLKGSYSISINRGAPDATFTEGGILNDLTQLILAGTEVQFYLLVKDQQGSQLNKKEVMNYVENFNVSVMFIDENILLDLEISQGNVVENGEIRLKITLKKTGFYKFLPSYDANEVKCSICAINIEANIVDVNNVKISLLAGDSSMVLKENSTILLDNNQIVPTFLMEFYDIYQNKMKIVSNFSDFIAILHVSNSNFKYTFLGNPYMGNILFTMDSEENKGYFQKELNNTNCFITFNGLSVSDQRRINKTFQITLKGGEFDEYFTYDDPDPDNILLIPTKVSRIAGVFISVSVELRAKNGKLFYDQSNNGFYPDNLIAFSLIPEDETTGFSLQIYKGKLNGTYILTFNVTKASYFPTNVYLSYANHDNNSVFIKAKSPLILTVLPANPEFLVVKDQKQLQMDCISNTRKVVYCEVFDRFNNRIYNVETGILGLKFLQENTTIIPSLSQNLEGVFAAMLCKKAGKVVFRGLSFRNEGISVENYTFSIVSGDPEPSTSLATLNINEINAGESAEFRIFPFDLYGNKILIEKSSSFITIFTSSFISPNSLSSQNLTVIKVSDDKNYLYFSNVFDIAGSYSFKAYYNNLMVFSNNFVLKVKPLVANWDNSKLSTLDILTGFYNEYEQAEVIIQSIFAYPEFMINLYDIKGNSVDKIPENWLLSVKLSESDMDYPLIFCEKASKPGRFVMCEDNSLQSFLAKSPKKRWDELVQNKTYEMSIGNNGVFRFGGFLNVTGNDSDTGTSNLPIDINNTIITPLTPLITNAGVFISFSIELRTTNKNLRPNWFYNEANSNISFDFKYDNDKKGSVFNTSVKRAEKHGKYLASVLSYKTYLEKDPNTINLSFDNVKFLQKVPVFIVNPGEIHRIQPYDADKNELLADLSQGNADNVYSVNFKAFDVWNNEKPIKEADFLQIALYFSDDSSINFERKISENGLLQVNFQPKSVGNYTYVVALGGNYTFEVLEGEVSAINSFGTVNITANSSVKAGNFIEISVSFYDKWGNTITISENLLKKLYVKYYYKRPDVTEGYIIGNNSVKFLENSTNSLFFLEKVTIKGTYSFKITIKNLEIPMKDSSVKVIPSVISLKNSNLRYYDTGSSQYLLMLINNAIKEDNLHTTPSYTLELADSYSNTYDIFPAEFITKITFLLFGNDFDEILNPIPLNSSFLLGNSLYASINDTNNYLRYQAAVYCEKPYSLRISLEITNETVIFPIILLGNGQNDSDAASEKPLNLSLTVFSKNSLNFKAGEYDSFIVELHDINNKRKVDINPNFSYNFMEFNGLSQGNFSGFAIAGDLRGRFRITINGTKANIKTGPTILRLSVNGEEISQKVLCNISPNTLKKIEIPTNLSTRITTDNTFSFEVFPYDNYENLVESVESDVNLLVKYPGNRSSYTTVKDLLVGKLIYTVNCRDSGVYFIQSPLLDSIRNFSVLSGKPSAETSLVSIDLISLIVGENSTVYIIPVDANNNRISPWKNPEILSQFSLKIETRVTTIAFSFEIDGKNDRLFSTFTTNITGVASVIPSVNSQKIICDTCSVVFKPGPLDLSKTKFFTHSYDENFIETNTIQISYGSSRLSFIGYLFDKYNNAISSTNDSETFQMTLSGNNMLVLRLEVSKQNPNILLFDLNTTDSSEFSSIVPALNYSLNLTYLLDKNPKGTDRLTLQIIGQDNGAGNGEWAWVQIDPLPTLKLIAGVEGFFRMVFFTDQNRRYNGIIDPNTVRIYDDSNISFTSHETLSMKVYSGDANGKISLGFLGKIAISPQKQKNISFTVNGNTVNQKLFIYIIPNAPDLMFTNVTNGLTVSSVSGVQQSITLRFFDAFLNAFPTAGLTNKVFASVQKGLANFSDTISQNEYTFVVPITPIYPPSQLQIMIFYKWSDTIIYPILSTPLTTYVYTYLDASKTEIIGNSLPGISTDQEFKFYVLLKDKAGYCFEENKNVTLYISGPFIANSPNPLASVFTMSPLYMNASETSMNSSKMTNTTYACQKLYYGYLQPESLQKEGYYKIEAFIEGELGGKAVKSLNYTYVAPGPTAPEKSLLSVPALLNRGRTPLDLEVNSPILFKLKLSDKFSNILSEIRNTTQLSAKLTGFNYTDYKLLITNNSDGSYTLNLTVQKTGTFKALLINLNGKELKYEDLQKFDVPESIEIIPGRCSAKKVLVENSVFLSTNVTVGETNTFILQCRDEFENIITRGGEGFQTLMAGSNLDVVIVSYGSTLITDENNGKYTYTFVVSWAGNYTITIDLAGDPVSQPFYVFATRLRCNDVNKTVYCENKNICAKSSLDCEYKFFENCSDPLKPYNCKVNGESACVAGHFECDCDEGYYKCPADNKCILFEFADILCSNVLMLNCPSEYPHNCPAGSCRVDPLYCPSQPGCPPGYSLCADQTCASTTTGCKDFNSNFYECPQTEPWKCEDQSCVEDPSLCPTRITCNNQNDVICPDKTCASSELNCRPPAKCPGMDLCPDQSCRPSRDDCPKAITCPNGYALCEDKTCKTECNNLLKKKFRMLQKLKNSHNNRRLYDTVTVQECAQNYSVCPGGECVPNVFLCPSVQSCGPNKRVCPDFSCAGTSERCIVKSCGNAQVLCWDGKCVDSFEKCSTRTTCPSEYPIKCLDGSCTMSTTDCPTDIKCPAYYPYRCATGECRANQKECPTLITCPENKPIQCTDGSCVATPFNCLNVTLLRKCDYNEILCPDGSCALSKLLCPPIASCNPNQIRCWDNTCVNNITDCDPLEPTRDVCPIDKKLRCPDGSCRAFLKDCPTQLICPVTRPVKCDDGTCKQSIEQCALGTECGYGLKRCPDGSCTSNENLCGTPITCSRASPYICFDGTCKKDPRDCATPPTCSQSVPILCPDGTCTSQRVNCKRLSKCDAKTPVRCPNMNCYASVDDCNAIDGCPAGKVMCEDGSCASYVSYCPSKKCPDHLSLKCPDGLCVNDLSLCDNNSTGCPYSKPHKCPDGQCSVNSTFCLNPNASCPNGLFLCPDGSCALANGSCQNIFGCPWESPMLCASGECIDPSKGSCPVASCPKETPVKCMDGLCANSITTCPSFFTAVEISQCLDDPKGNMIPCADGRCVTSSELCRPLFKCPNGRVRCGDGSCRSMQALCPLINSTCPKVRSFRCNIGACAASQEDCPNENNGCPLKAPVKCSNTGSCMKTQSDCEDYKNRTILLNNCSMEKPFLCHNESSTDNKSYCVSSLSQCVNSLAQCLSTQIKCPNGLCALNVSLCKANCPVLTCPNGRCGNDLKDCLAENGCPLHTPFLCNDGSCKQTPLAINGEKGCLPNLVCPEYKPYLCSNGECQGAPSQCQVHKPCPEEKPFQCPDYSCATNEKECYGQNLCPIATPILCGSGRCEKTPMECLDSATNPMYCSDEKPVLCASGQCEKYAWNCTDKETRTGNLKKARILLSNGDTRVLAEGDTITNLAVCSDGSFRTNVKNCLIIPSCQPGQYRCNSSACVDKIQECLTSELLISVCVSGSIRCLDGICREKCLDYQGCPFENNYHCGNGLCAKNEGECAGDSVCETGFFRCIDNRCVNDVRTCSIPLRNYLAEQFKITVSPLMTTSINFIQQGTSSIKLATLTLPAGALLPNQQNLNNTSFSLQGLGLMINPVSHSKIVNYTTVIEPTRINYVEKIFPYNAGYIGFHQTVRAPIVNLETINRASDAYKFPLLLEISADVITNTNKAEDYCLATINNYTNNWECVSRQLLNNDELTTNKFTYPVPQDGIYTVVFSPGEKIEVSNDEECGWFCQNKWTILYVFIGIIIAGLIGSYVIWRISRYVNKYKAAKKQMADFREQINEMEKAKTDVLGQTLKDKIEGISFTTNPAFRKESSACNFSIFLVFFFILHFFSGERKRKEIVGFYQ